MERQRILIIGSLAELSARLCPHYDILHAELPAAPELLGREWVHLCLIGVTASDADAARRALDFITENAGPPPKILVLSESFDSTSQLVNTALAGLESVAPAAAVVTSTHDLDSILGTIRLVLERRVRANAELRINPEYTLGDLANYVLPAPAPAPVFHELQDLLRILFFDATSINIQRLHELCHENDRIATLWVEPRSAVLPRQQPLIVKVGVRASVERLRDRYETYLFKLTRMRLAGYAQTRNFAALAYPSPCDHPDVYHTDFPKFYQMKANTGAADDIGKAIDYLFESAFKPWHQQVGAPPHLRGKGLRSYYLDRFGLAGRGSFTQAFDRLVALAPEYGVLIRRAGSTVKIKLAEAFETYPDPLAHLYGTVGSIKRFNSQPGQLRISHCNLRGKNMCVDADNVVWLDGYDGLGWGPAVADVAGVEAVLKFHCLEDNLRDLYQFEKLILSATQFGEAPAASAINSKKIRHALRWISHLRHGWGRKYASDMSEYYTNLFFFTMRELTAEDISDLQKLHALISAAMICHRLKQWPRLDWPGTGQVAFKGGILTEYRRLPAKALGGGDGATDAPEQYDLFLSYNSRDQDAVESLNQRLRARGVRTWKADKDLKPGVHWQKQLEAVIDSVRVAAVLIGQQGLQGWESEEVMALLDKSAKDQKKLIPVMLPGAPDWDNLSLFLKQRHCIDLRADSDGGEFNRLVAACLEGSLSTP